MYILYDLIFTFYVIFAFFYYLIKKKLHKEIVLRFRPHINAGLERPIWIHAVSVGEVKAAKNIYVLLKKSFPDKDIIISTVTPAGNIVAKSFISGQGQVIYLPLDYSFIVRRFVKIIDPGLFICIETEIWPNLIYFLHKRNIPIVMVNGRISQGSFAGYKLFRFFLSPILKKISIFCMQTESDAQRVIMLGAPSDRVVITGNIKFDLEPPTKVVSKLDLGLDSSCFLLIAGSTHRGEERILFEVYKELKNDFVNLKLLLAPRHIDRVKELEELAKQLGLETLRFSQRADRNSAFDIMLLDTIGELAAIYSAGDIVFIGGSLVDKGGQNIIEPAMLSKPVIFGHNMSNFAQIKKIFLKEKAAIQVRDKAELKKALKSLLSDANSRKVIGKKASEIIAKNNGAARRTLDLISRFIK